MQTRAAYRPPTRSLIIAGVAAILCLAAAVLAPARAAAAYLTAYVACVAVVLGALAMIMIARVTAATWFVVLRRQAEQIVATLPALALLFIPVLAAAHVLYPWARPDSSLPSAVREAVHAKAAYLNLPFFIARAAVYWSTWIALGELLRRASLAQDHGDSPAVERRMRILCAVGLPAFALTVTFASFDWMMSLSPTWYSTIYGVDYFAGAMVGALSLIALLIARGRWRDELPSDIGADHMHALAKLLLTFVLFWVYIGFSQFIVIWSAELPAETTWYVARTRGGWGLLAGVLVAGHFALPFCALLIRSVKRSVVAMTAIGAWLLLMHYLDVYWIVMPDTASNGSAVIAHGIDAAMLTFVASVASVAWSIRRRAEASIATGDPRVNASLAYTTDSV